MTDERQDLTTLFNMALGAIGNNKRISSHDAAGSQAETCRLYYPRVRDHVLRAAHWVSCRELKALALISDNSAGAAWNDTLPPPRWKYAYEYPDDCLQPRSFTDFTPFVAGRIRSGGKKVQAFFTNTQNPILDYTYKELNPGLWDESLFMAITYGLAGFIAYPLTGKRSIVEMNIQQANTLITAARINTANEDDDMPETLAPWHEARTGGGVTNTSITARYYYPNIPLLSAGVSDA